MLHKKTVHQCVVGVASVVFFIRHFVQLSNGTLNYDYNMKANVATGLLCGSAWMAWYFVNARRKSYAWKMAAFQLLVAASLSLELLDFAPIWWTFDAHALWHMSTVPLTMLLYSFLIDDCNAMREKRSDIESKRLV